MSERLEGTEEAEEVAAPLRRKQTGEFWRVERAARYLDLSCKRVYQMIEQGDLPALKLGRRCIRIPRAAVMEFVARGETLGPCRCDESAELETE